MKQIQGRMLMACMVFLVLVSLNVSSALLTDFNQIHGLEISSAGIRYPGTMVSVFLDTRDSVLFSSESCLAPVFNSHVLSRQIKQFGTEHTQIVFSLQENLFPENLDQNYFLATQCLNSVDLHSSVDFNFVEVPFQFSISQASTQGIVDASFTENALMSLNNLPTVGTGQGWIEAVTQELDANSFYKIHFTFNAKTGTTRPNCVTVQASARFNSSDIWSRTVSTPEKVSDDLYFELTPEPASILSDPRFHFHLEETRQGVCNTETPFAEELRVLSLFQASNIFAQLSSSGWHSINRAPEAKFVFTPPWIWSLIQIHQLIEFEYSDPDSDSNLLVSLGWHSREEPVLAHSILLNQILAQQNYTCSTADLNLIQQTQCAVDWNSVPHSDSNIVLDLNVCDSFTCTVTHSSSFVLDNGFPILEILAPKNQAHFLDSNFFLDVNAADAETGIQKLQYSLNDSNFFDVHSTPFSVHGLVFGENTLKVQAVDFANNAIAVTWILFQDAVQETTVPAVPNSENPFTGNSSAGGGGGSAGMTRVPAIKFFEKSNAKIDLFSDENVNPELKNLDFNSFFSKHELREQTFSIPCVFSVNSSVPVFLKNRSLILPLFYTGVGKKIADLQVVLDFNSLHVSDVNQTLDCLNFSKYILRFSLDQNGRIEFLDLKAFIFLDSNDSSLAENLNWPASSTGFLIFNDSVIFPVIVTGLLILSVLAFFILNSKQFKKLRKKRG